MLGFLALRHDFLFLHDDIVVDLFFSLLVLNILLFELDTLLSCLGFQLGSPLFTCFLAGQTFGFGLLVKHLLDGGDGRRGSETSTWAVKSLHPLFLLLLLLPLLFLLSLALLLLQLFAQSLLFCILQLFQLLFRVQVRVLGEELLLHLLKQFGSVDWRLVLICLILFTNGLLDSVRYSISFVVI